MKMKLWDRLLLALYALLGLVLLAWCAVNVVAPSLADEIVALARDIWQEPLFMVIMCAAALVLVAWTVRVFLLAFKHEPRKDKTSVSVQNTDNGAVRVSLAAMEALVHQAIGSSEDVVNIKSKIVNHDDSISVKIDMTLAGNAHIPNVTMMLQRNIKSFIEEYCGIAVREVFVLVSSIVPSEGPVAIAETSQAAQAAEEIVVEPEAAREEAQEACGECETEIKPDAAYEQAVEEAIAEEESAREETVEDETAEEVPEDVLSESAGKREE